MQIGEEHLPLLQSRALRALGLLHLDDELRLPGVADPRAGFLVNGVRGADSRAGAFFHDDLMAMRYQLTHRRRGEADAVLVRLDLCRDADDHKRFTLPRASGIDVCSPSSIFAI
jgi:hypothetical protein